MVFFTLECFRKNVNFTSRSYELGKMFYELGKMFVVILSLQTRCFSKQCALLSPELCMCGIIVYGNEPISGKFKLQLQYSLSTTSTFSTPLRGRSQILESKRNEKV
jgi:hypothetical protein